MGKIGVHLSISGGMHKALLKANDLHIKAIQIFLKNSNRWEAKPYTQEVIASFIEARSSMPECDVFAHSGYLINLAGIGEVRVKSLSALADELNRAEQLQIEYLVLHPGSHGDRGLETGITAVADNLSTVFERCKKTKILLETTAGQGSSIGHRFEQLRAIIDACSFPDMLGVCLDTCHTFVSGYELTTEEGYRDTITQADITFGVDAVRVWHCNDAKAARGSKLDRHEHIGQGNIGVEPFRWLLNDPRFADCAFIAETPNDEPGDEERNVKVLKSLVA